MIALLLALPVPAAADTCDDLIDRVRTVAGATLDERSRDFARFSSGPDTSLTLSCAHPDPSSVGVQFRGKAPPEGYYDLFGKVGYAVTGVSAEIIADAAKQARDAASRLRHSNVEAGGVRVTCSVTAKDDGPLTLCAVIEHANRS